MSEQRCCIHCMTVTDQNRCPACGGETEPANRPRLAAPLPPETILNGRYLLGAALGGGGFGVTYRALKLTSLKPRLGTVVAIKEYFPHKFAQRMPNDYVYAKADCNDIFLEWRSAFLREYNTLSKLGQCASVVHVLDTFEANNTAYLVMDFIDGETIEKRVRTRGPMPPVQLLDLLRPFLQDMIDLHEHQVLHRDMNPANIIINKQDQLVLIDFGSARPNNLSEPKTVCIRPGFAPPEQYVSKQEQRSGLRQGPWTDVYGLCGTLYFALTGVEPPDGKQRQAQDTLIPLEKLCPKLPSKVAQAIMAGLQLDPTRRPTNFTILSEMLYGTACAAQPGYSAPLPVPAAPAALPERLLAAERAAQLLSWLAPRKYRPICQKLDAIKQLDSMPKQQEALTALLQRSGKLLARLAAWYAA